MGRAGSSTKTAIFSIFVLDPAQLRVTFKKRYKKDF